MSIIFFHEIDNQQDLWSLNVVMADFRCILLFLSRQSNYNDLYMTASALMVFFTFVEF